MTLLTPQEVTSFLDATEGSVIEVEGPQFPNGGNARVIQLIKEFGATHIPALHIQPDNGEPTVISSNGQHTIRIIKGTKGLAGKYTPDSVVDADLIPERVKAVRFEGGAEQAVELVRWTAGRATVVYLEGDRDNPERLEIRSLNLDAVLSIGDWLILHEDDVFEPLSSDAYAKRYVTDVKAKLGSVK